ncbi:hypothetical protein ACY3NT_003122 [Enterobacter sichuanensis]
MDLRRPDRQGNPSDSPPDAGFTSAPALALNVILRTVTSRRSGWLPLREGPSFLPF